MCSGPKRNGLSDGMAGGYVRTDRERQERERRGERKRLRRGNGDEGNVDVVRTVDVRGVDSGQKTRCRCRCSAWSTTTRQIHHDESNNSMTDVETGHAWYSWR